MGKIVETLAIMLPHWDFVVNFAERISKDPSKLVVWSQRLESSPDSWFCTDELVIEIRAFNQHYTMGSAHHLAFDLQVEDLVSSQCELVLVSYHPLWDGLAPSFVNGISCNKLDCLRYRHTQDILAEVGVGSNVSDTYGYYHLHSAVGCEFQLDEDTSIDRVGVSVGSSFEESSISPMPTINFQMILLLILFIWEFVLQELDVYNRDNSQLYL